MGPCSNIQRDFKAARRLASWLVSLSIFAALGVVPANAETINVADSGSSGQAAFSIVDQLALATEGPWQSNNGLFDWSSLDRTGCGARANENDAPTPTSQPVIPFEPLPGKVDFVGIGIPGPSTGGGMDSGSPSGSGGSSTSNAIVGCVSALPQPVVVGRLYSILNLDIPSAPPFELLRPPKTLTIFA